MVQDCVFRGLFAIGLLDARTIRSRLRETLTISRGRSRRFLPDSRSRSPSLDTGSTPRAWEPPAPGQSTIPC
jgi:hypothetical protein